MRSDAPYTSESSPRVGHENSENVTPYSRQVKPPAMSPKTDNSLTPMSHATSEYQPSTSACSGTRPAKQARHIMLEWTQRKWRRRLTSPTNVVERMAHVVIYHRVSFATRISRSLGRTLQSPIVDCSAAQYCRHHYICYPLEACPL